MARNKKPHKQLVQEFRETKTGECWRHGSHKDFAVGRSGDYEVLVCRACSRLLKKNSYVRKKSEFKWQEFERTGSAECVRHGYHNNWQLSKRSSGNSVKCRLCRNEYHKKQDYTETWPSRWRYILKKTKRRDIAAELDKDFLQNLLESQQYKCRLTSRDLTPKNCSIDRIDPSIGYIASNVQLVTKEANYAKHKLTETEFIILCKDVLKTIRKN